MLHDDVRALFRGGLVPLGYLVRFSHQCPPWFMRGGSCLAAGHLFADFRSHGAVRPRLDGPKHLPGLAAEAMPIHGPRPAVGESAHAASPVGCRDRMVPSRSP